MTTTRTRLALAALLAAAPALAQAPATARKEVLLQADHSWNGAAYAAYPAGTPQLTMLKLTIAAHSALPWHTHPFPNAGYILSGELTLQDRQSGKSHVFHAGQAFAETVDDVHRGVTGDEPVVVLITYAGITGKPTSVPAHGEKAEY